MKTCHCECWRCTSGGHCVRCDWNQQHPLKKLVERRKLSLVEILQEHWFDGYTLCTCKHEKFDIPMEELEKKYPCVNRYVFKAKQRRAYAEHIADIVEKMG